MNGKSNSFSPYNDITIANTPAKKNKNIYGNLDITPFFCPEHWLHAPQHNPAQHAPAHDPIILIITTLQGFYFLFFVLGLN